LSAVSAVNGMLPITIRPNGLALGADQRRGRNQRRAPHFFQQGVLQVHLVAALERA
jgi:hypothetical protein